MDFNYIFDSTDKKILKYLIRDARTKVVEIAENIGVTSAAIHQRLAKIKKSGAIEKFTLQLNAKVLGYKTCAFIGVFMQQNGHYQDVVDRLKLIPEVTEAHYTTGEYGLFIKVYAMDNDHLMQILSSKIQKIPGISRTETFISLEHPITRSVPV